MPRRYYDNYHHDRVPDHSVRNRIVAGALVAAITFGGGYGINRATGIIDHGLQKLSQFVNPEKDTDTPTPTATPTTTPTQTPSPTPRPPEATPPKLFETKAIYDNLVVTFDSEGVPKSYIQDGVTVDILEKSKAAQRASKSNHGEVEIISIIPTKDSEGAPQPDKKNDDSLKTSPDRPLLKSPPETVSIQELTKRGIVISQSADVKLSIRPEAFTTGPLKYYTASSKYGLHIVLINGPRVTTNYLSVDQAKYAPLIPAPPTAEEIKKYKEQFLKDYQDGIEEIRGKMATAKDADERKFYGSVLLSYKYQLLKFTRDDDAIVDILSRRNEMAAGLYVPCQNNTLSGIGKNSDKSATTYVFVAVGGKSNTKTTSEVIISVDEFGFKVGQVSSQSLSTGMNPQLNQSYPRPSDFEERKVDPQKDPDGYPFGAQSPGFALRHELKHDQLICQTVSVGNWPEQGEYVTDKATMEDITQAFKKWQESGYKDDSGYYFVLTFDKGRKHILTKNENITEKPQPKSVAFSSNLGKDKQNKQPWKQEVARARQYNPSSRT